LFFCEGLFAAWPIKKHPVEDILKIQARERGNYVESHHMACYKKGHDIQLVTSAFFVDIIDGCCICLTEFILPSVDWLRVYNIQDVTRKCAKL
jgi:hypothetical protein